MILWRITKRKYAKRDLLLSGDGAKEYGGRWNLPGLPAIYTSSTSSLALLETLVHAEPNTLPDSLVAVQVVVPDSASKNEIVAADLPRSWRQIGDRACAERGSEWLRSGISLLLVVPSAVNPLESNVVINPAHKELKRCTIGSIIDVTYDPRLLSLLGAK